MYAARGNFPNKTLTKPVTWTCRSNLQKNRHQCQWFLSRIGTIITPHFTLFIIPRIMTFSRLCLFSFYEPFLFIFLSWVLKWKVLLWIHFNSKSHKQKISRWILRGHSMAFLCCLTSNVSKCMKLFAHCYFFLLWFSVILKHTEENESFSDVNYGRELKKKVGLHSHSATNYSSFFSSTFVSLKVVEINTRSELLLAIIVNRVCTIFLLLFQCRYIQQHPSRLKLH